MMMQRSLQKTAKAFQPQAIFAAGMATEKAILEKMTSTKNITKITSSMKMVAASKLRGDQNRLEVRDRSVEKCALCPVPPPTPVALD